MINVGTRHHPARWLARLALGSALATLIVLGAGPRIGLFRTLVVRSGSMGAAMPAGSLAVVTPHDPAEIEAGHIITYHVPGREEIVVSHRVVEIDTGPEGTTFRTKGDKNQQPDPWTATVTGTTAWRVRTAIPGLGWAVVAFGTPWVRYTASVAAPLLLAMMSVGAIWSRPKGDGSANSPMKDAGRSYPVPAFQRFTPPIGLSATQREWSRLAQSTGARQEQQGSRA